MKAKSIECPYTFQCKWSPEKRCRRIGDLTKENADPNRFSKPLHEPWQSWEQYGQYWAIPEKYNIHCSFPA